MRFIADYWFKVGIVAGLILLGTGSLIFRIKYVRPAEKIPPTTIVRVEKSASVEEIQDKINLSSVIRQWHPAIAKIDCYFKDQGEKIYAQSGSGFLKRSGDESRVLTNRHIILDETDNMRQAQLCKIELPGNNDYYIAEGIESENGISDLRHSTSTLDWGYIIIRYPESELKPAAFDNLAFCAKQQELGQPVIILGYPEVGSKNDITVTQGIISGYEDGYYITDAKIGHGNSGGVAISLDLKEHKSCFMGIPTFVEVGEIIDLGRILDIRAISPDW